MSERGVREEWSTTREGFRQQRDAWRAVAVELADALRLLTLHLPKDHIYTGQARVKREALATYDKLKGDE